MKIAESKLKYVYGAGASFNAFSKRVDKLSKEFYDNFGVISTDIFSSPGRIEICGNHTDHNNGLVIVSAIDCDTLCVTSKNKNVISIISEGFPDILVDVNDIKYSDGEKSTSLSLVKGILKGFLDKGFSVGGFFAEVNSTVFAGAGVSSSASFELLVCQILNFYYNGGKISPVELAKISQFAENKFFGKPCGLLDQMGVALGGVSMIDFADNDNPKIEKLGYGLSELSVILVNTGNHANLTGEYSSIREEMREIAAFFNKKTLREVPKSLFLSQLSQLHKNFDGRTLLRALHFYNENERVVELSKAIKDKKIKHIINIINESGESSATLLQNYYPPLDKEQGIALAVNVAKALCPSCAARVHGGGFAGTCVIFVEKYYQNKLYSDLASIFGEKNLFSASIRETGAIKLND